MVAQHIQMTTFQQVGGDDETGVYLLLLPVADTCRLDLVVFVFFYIGRF